MKYLRTLESHEDFESQDLGGLYVVYDKEHVHYKNTSKIPANEIWYTTIDGRICPTLDIPAFEESFELEPAEDYLERIRYTEVSNIYENGKGIVTYQEPVTKIGIDCFEEETLGYYPTFDVKWQGYGNNLKEVWLPYGVTRIEDYAFLDCDNLKTIHIPDTVEFIGVSAFDGCKTLEYIKLPKNLTEIDTEAFIECHNLKYIEIPEGVTTLGDSAFRLCKSLETIYIPSTVTYIGEHCFQDCKALKKIIHNGSQKSWRLDVKKGNDWNKGILPKIIHLE